MPHLPPNGTPASHLREAVPDLPPYLTHQQTTNLLDDLGFNSHDRECVLDLTPTILTEAGPLYPLNRIERMLNRAYWLGLEDIVSEIAVSGEAA